MLPQLITDLALILGLAAITTLICRWLKQPVVLGYILAGYIAGNHFGYAPDVKDMHSIHTLAEMGIVFLLFGLGLEFSFKKLMKVGAAAVTTALVIIAGMMFLGFECGKLLGWSDTDSIFLAAMLSMSSTTIILKALSDLGLKSQKFSSLVFGILIVEDLFAIVMMVVLSTVFIGKNVEGGEMVLNIVKLLFFLILWLGVGLYIVPVVLEKSRKWLTREILLLVSLGMCLGMVVLANYVGFSSALGAFIMGSIFAETVEVKDIEKVTLPVRDLFGAVFFVSVGMMVDPELLMEYWKPVVLITLVVIFGQIIFATAGLLLSGQKMDTAIRSSFSLVQIGEFAFIIATLGASLGVISSFLYPVAVGVSVVTTFLTPFIIKLAPTVSGLLDKVIPERFKRSDNKVVMVGVAEKRPWNEYLKGYVLNILLFGVLIFGGIWLLKVSLQPFLFRVFEGIRWGNFYIAIIFVIMLSPLLWAMALRDVRPDAFGELWKRKVISRSVIVLLYTVRILLAVVAVVVLLDGVYETENSLFVGLLILVVILLVFARRIKRFWRHFHRQLSHNLRDKHGLQIIDKRLNDLHITNVDFSADSLFIGRSIGELQLNKAYGVTVVSIRRGGRTLVVPSAREVFMPLDVVAVVGSDEDLRRFSKFAQEELPVPPPADFTIHQWWIRASSPLVGRTVAGSYIRESYGCLIVAMCRVDGREVRISAGVEFEAGDVVWLAGEKSKVREVVERFK